MQNTNAKLFPEKGWSEKSKSVKKDDDCGDIYILMFSLTGVYTIHGRRVWIWFWVSSI